MIKRLYGYINSKDTNKELNFSKNTILDVVNKLNKNLEK